MFARKGMAVVALSAILACGGLVRGADTAGTSNTGSNPSSFQTNQPVMLQDTGTSAPPTAPGTPAPAAAPAAPAAAAPAPTPPTPLMAGLEKIGVGQTLENMNIHIGGYVEGSWTFDANH